MRHHSQSEQWLPYPIETLFAFLANPANLPRLMPAWQSARIEDACIVPPPQSILSPSATVAAGIGSQLTLTFRPFPYSPIRIAWIAKITEFVWNHHFCDRQLSGPFAYWNHCHRVRTETRNAIPGTLITDDVEYELPLGPLGELAHRLLLHKQIAHTFAYRQSRLAQLLATAPQP